jgi:hypothetical protein
MPQMAPVPDPVDTARAGRATAPARGVWIASAVAVVALGVLSAVTHAQVPILWMVDFGVHEFGHMITGWAPYGVMLAAGSFSQVAFPLGLAAYFEIGRGETWAAAPLLAWAGTSLRNVAVYIADAPYQRLQLWGGENVVHDWAQLLAGRAIQHAAAYAWFADTVGWLLVATAFALALTSLVAQGGADRLTASR